MKILVVSLLRLGDLIQQKQLLSALRAKHPEAEIHLLINKQFANVTDLFVNEKLVFHFFDRDLLQRMMGESSFNMFSVFDQLEETIQDLNSEEFDAIYNWTHNKLSAFLIGLINANEKFGIFVSESRLQGLSNNSWLRYFNDNFSENSKSLFHYTEILSNAFGLNIQRANVIQKDSNLILFQCLTSDSKKNLPIEKFQALKNEIIKKHPNFQIRILSSANEYTKLTQYFDLNEIIECDLTEVAELLKQAKVLITLDTSIKHLAVENHVPTIEISLGSSDLAKTSAFQATAIAVSAKSDCYPCRHSKTCPQSSHLCAESISVAEIMNSFDDFINGSSFKDKTLTDQIFELERAVWISYLNSTDIQFQENPVLAFEIQDDHNVLVQYQAEFESCENFNEIFDKLQTIQAKKIDTGHYFQKLHQVFSDKYANAESALAALKKALNQSGELLKIRDHYIESSLSKGQNFYERET